MIQGDQIDKLEFDETNARVVELLREPDAGRVTGLVVEAEGVRRSYTAR